MARDPEQIHSFYEYADAVPDVIRLKDLPPCTIPDYDLDDEKSFKKYLYDIERIVRGSNEYHKMLNYLRDYLDMNKCSFYESVSNADTTKIRIEIHHEPLSLFDITEIVYRKRVAFHESLEAEYVAKEVMWLHYDMQVGLIPLSETVHELVHNSYLFIPNTKVYGKYKKFVQDYWAFISPELREVLERIDQLSLAYDCEEYKQLLAKKFIYVDVSGAYQLPRLEDISAMVKARIREVMDDPPEPRPIPIQAPPWEPIIFLPRQE